MNPTEKDCQLAAERSGWYANPEAANLYTDHYVGRDACAPGWCDLCRSAGINVVVKRRH